jgi:pyrroline-5-carboxylate reductase
MEKVMTKAQILLVGCGAMGSALKKGWEQVNMALDVTVIDPSNAQYLADSNALPADFMPDVIVLAVKPQTLPSVLPSYIHFAQQGSLVISIAAGIPLRTYHKILGEDAWVIRAMPNLPVIVGQGMTVLTTQQPLSKNYRTLGETLFAASGKVIWLEDEKLMDVVTAVSGSGPAYFFKMVEELAKAGIAGGLPSDVATQLARQTAVGAGAMMQHLTDSAMDLKIRVTSPEGTTAAALTIFDQDNALGILVLDAVKAAIRRSKELSQ